MLRKIILPILCLILLSALPAYSMTYERIDAPEYDLTNLDREDSPSCTLIKSHQRFDRP